MEQLLKMINRIGMPFLPLPLVLLPSPLTSITPVSLGSLEAHPTDKPSHKKEVGGLIIDARNIPSIDAKYVSPSTLSCPSF